MARDYVEHEFGVAPGGPVAVGRLRFRRDLRHCRRRWDSAGPPATAASWAARWAAPSAVDAIYRPYRWEQNARQIGVVFRDHFLSDLIGFVYSAWTPPKPRDDFLNRIRENCRGILAAGRDALVPIILDGENAWEYYDRNGRPFLRHLYRLISGRRADVRRDRRARRSARWSPSR